MALTAQRARPPGPRLFEGPVLLGRTRRDIAELIGFAWLTIEIVRLVRSRFEKPTPVAAPWNRLTARDPRP